MDIDEFFIGIGGGNVVQKPNVLGIFDYYSLPIKKYTIVKNQRYELVDATKGKSCKSVILLANGFIVLSYLSVKEVCKLNRIQLKE